MAPSIGWEYMLSTDGATCVAGLRMFDHQMAQSTWPFFGHSIMAG